MLQSGIFFHVVGKKNLMIEKEAFVHVEASGLQHHVVVVILIVACCGVGIKCVLGYNFPLSNYFL